jgi:hypothetical protein
MKKGFVIPDTSVTLNPSQTSRAKNIIKFKVCSDKSISSLLDSPFSYARQVWQASRDVFRILKEAVHVISAPAREIFQRRTSSELKSSGSTTPGLNGHAIQTLHRSILFYPKGPILDFAFWPIVTLYGDPSRAHHGER